MLLLKQCAQFIFNSFELESALMKRIRFLSQRADLLVNVAAAEPRGLCLQLCLCVAAGQAKRVDFQGSCWPQVTALLHLYLQTQDCGINASRLLPFPLYFSVPWWHKKTFLLRKFPSSISVPLSHFSLAKEMLLFKVCPSSMAHA